MARARGDAQPDSDWDLLVLLPGPVNAARVSRVRRAIYEVECESGEVLSTIVRSQEAWHSPDQPATPLRLAVQREGVLL